MSGRPRRDVIDDDVVGIYHCWTRCVRRAFLCGDDPVADCNYDHRKDWIYERLEALSRIFAVDACVSAVLSNHYHLIVRNRPDLADGWSDQEVVLRWWQLYPERRDAQGQPAEPTAVEIRSITSDAKRVGQLRTRLRSISWFMKSLNEHIARRANAEESQEGHFWQERFGCRRLLDTAAVLACCVYVDLNEIRAELARNPEQSHNTSAYRRILGRLLRRDREFLQQAAVSEQTAVLPSAAGTDTVPHSSMYQIDAEDPDFWLCPIDETSQVPLLGPGPVDRDVSRAPPGSSSTAPKQYRHGFLPMTLDQYLQVLDSTGRQWTSGKRGVIEADLPPILERLGLRTSGWLQLVEQFDQLAHRAFGSPRALIEEARQRGRRWLHGIRVARDCFL